MVMALRSRMHAQSAYFTKNYTSDKPFNRNRTVVTDLHIIGTLCGTFSDISLDRGDGVPLWEILHSPQLTRVIVKLMIRWGNMTSGVCIWEHVIHLCEQAKCEQWFVLLLCQPFCTSSLLGDLKCNYKLLTEEFPYSKATKGISEVLMVYVAACATDSEHFATQDR